jgi:hypothetical protein
MMELIKERPYSIAKIFRNMGMTYDMLDELVTNVWRSGNTGSSGGGTTYRRPASLPTAQKSNVIGFERPKSNDNKPSDDDRAEWQGALADYYRQNEGRLLADDSDLAGDDLDDRGELLLEDEADPIEAIYCNDCEEITPEEDLRWWPKDGDPCGFCESLNTSVIEVTDEGEPVH